MKVEAWKCERTGVLFADEASYLRHKEETFRRREVMVRRKAELIEATNMAKDIKSIDSINDIPIWLMDNPMILGTIQCCILNMRWSTKTSSGIDPMPIQLYNSYFDGIKYGFSHKVLATHSSPRGRPSNFTLRKTIPTSYPGFKGRFKFSVEVTSDMRKAGINSVDSEAFEALDVHTGSGGGNWDNTKTSTNFTGSYEVTLWAEDWMSVLFTMKLNNEFHATIDNYEGYYD